MLGFKIPVTVTDNFVKENVTGNIKESIDNFIELLVVCPNGSFKADNNFGFAFQNFRYVNCDANEQIDAKKLYGNSVNRDNYAYDLKLAIETYESRLRNVVVEMDYNASIKQVSLEITGKYEENFTTNNYQKNISFIIW